MKIVLGILTALSLLNVSPVNAARKIVLDARIEEAIEEFYEQTSAGKKLAKKAEGMLVFSDGRQSRFWNRRRIWRRRLDNQRRDGSILQLRSRVDRVPNRSVK